VSEIVFENTQNGRMSTMTVVCGITYHCHTHLGTGQVVEHDAIKVYGGVQVELPDS
jgi:hypothetical protein